MQVLGVHSHEHGGHEGGINLDIYLWQMLVGCGAIQGFFMLQMLLEYLNMPKDKAGNHVEVELITVSGVNNSFICMVEITQLSLITFTLFFFICIFILVEITQMFLLTFILSFAYSFLGK